MASSLERALRRLYRAFGSRLIGLAHRILGGRDEAEEAGADNAGKPSDTIILHGP